MVASGIVYNISQTSWFTTPFEFVRGRLKRLGWRRAAVIGGGAVAVYFVCRYLTSAWSNQSRHEQQHAPDNPAESVKDHRRAESTAGNKLEGVVYQEDDSYEAAGLKAGHRRTFSSPPPGTPAEDLSSESEAMFSADPNYSTNSIYLRQQTFNKMFKSSPFTMFNSYNGKENGIGDGQPGSTSARREPFEQNRSLETLKQNYELGRIPKILTRHRNSIGGSLKAILGLGQRSSGSLSREGSN